MYQLILVIISILLFSCSNKNIDITENNKKICESNNYNGLYNLRLTKDCNDDVGEHDFGSARLNIDECLLSVKNTFGASFRADPSNLDNWKTLNGYVSSEGEILGNIYMRPYFGNPEYRHLSFIGDIDQKNFKTKSGICNYTFYMDKVEKKKKEVALSKLDSEENEKSPTIIIPTGILGTISENQRIILEKTLESKLDNYFAIVPKDLFEQAQEKAFEELEYDECTEEQCIVKIQELLQVENAFKLLLVRDGNDTQLSLTWNNLDEKRVEEVYCENCNTKKLRETIEGIVEKLVKND